MSNPFLHFSNPLYIKKFYFLITSFLVGFVFFFAMVGSYKYLVIIFAFPLFILMLLNFRDIFIYLFLALMFIHFGVAIGFVGLLFVHLFSYAIIFYYLTNRDTEIFSQYTLPPVLKYSILILISAIFLSFIRSPFISLQSLFYVMVFVLYISTFYVLIKSVRNNDDINKYFKFYVLFAVISGIAIIIQILITGRSRSVGFTGYAYMGFAPNVLIIIVFKSFIFGKSSFWDKMSAIVIFITLITTQSRFAWLSFLLSFIYGLFIAYKFQEGSRKHLNKKIILISTLFFVLVVVTLFTGLGELIIPRITDISFDFFEVSDEGETVKNSLETRLLIWSVALNTFINNPLTGIGYLMFPVVSAQYSILPDFLYILFVEGLDAHNVYLNFLCETGIIGLLSFIFFLSVIFYYSFKSIKYSANSPHKHINSLILNILVFSIISTSAFSGAYTIIGQNPFEMYFYLAMAIGNYLYLKNDSSKEEITINRN